MLHKVRHFLLRRWLDDDGKKIAITKHALLVSDLKRLAIILSALLVLLVLVWPLISPGDAGFEFAFDDVEVTDNYKPRMVRPRLQGLDDNNQPYNMLAEEAIEEDSETLLLSQVSGDISTKDGAWISLMSETGEYKTSEKLLYLNGSVNLFMDSGYEMFTESAHIDLSSSEAVGNEEVFIQGTLGTLEAKGFVIRQEGDHVLFHGGVHLITYPEL